MSIWDDVAADDAAFTFTDPDAFGAEAVVYTPRSGTPRTVYAQVFRLGLVPDAQGVPRPTADVIFRNDATAGVAASTFNPGGDTATFAMDPNGAAVAHQLAKRQGGTWYDAGHVFLRVGSDQ